MTTLFRELLIGVTSFFRDPEAFERLASQCLPPILRSQHAGCSLLGRRLLERRKAHTMAMLARECMEQQGVARDVEDFATDIDRDALHYAAAGTYPESVAADVPPRLLSKYFFKKHETFQITRTIREMVVFAPHNLIRDPPFTNIALISCRNLLIYLQPVLQKRVLEAFNFSLQAQGLLMLGTSETTGDTSEFWETVDSKWKLYQSKGRHLKVGEPAPAGASDLGFRESKVRFTAARRTLRLAEEERLLERFLESVADDLLPLSIIVNAQQEVVHVVGRAEGFLKLPSGRLVNDIAQLAVKDLAVPLTTGIDKVLRQRQELRLSNVPIREGGEARLVELRIKPIPEKKGQEPLVAVFFVPQRPSATHPGVETFDVSREAESRMRELEQELQFTRENLQATIEELETSNEELQATNEELLASNEELQSTNEELQSTNEELFTVNAESQSKIIELTELHNDVDNLLASSQIGTLLLDENAHVRRFSPQIATLFHLLDSDIGRPIGHLTHYLKEIDFRSGAHRGADLAPPARTRGEHRRRPVATDADAAVQGRSASLLGDRRDLRRHHARQARRGHRARQRGPLPHAARRARDGLRHPRGAVRRGGGAQRLPGRGSQPGLRQARRASTRRARGQAPERAVTRYRWSLAGLLRPGRLVGRAAGVRGVQPGAGQAGARAGVPDGAGALRGAAAGGLRLAGVRTPALGPAEANAMSDGPDRGRSGGLTSALRSRAEALASQHRSDGEALLPGDVRALLHDLSVHQIELEIQNEELRGAQQLIARTRDEYAWLYNQAPVGYASLDASAMILQVNDTLARLLGTSVGALLQSPFAELLEESDREVFRARYRAFFQAPLDKSMEMRLAGRTGEPRVVLLTARRDHDGGLSPRGGEDRLLMVVHDVSDAYRAREALRAEKELLDVTLASIGEAVIATDVAGRITLMNRVAEGLAGWLLEEAQGQPLRRVLKLLAETTREVLPTPVPSSIAAVSGGLKLQALLEARDGTERAVACTASAIRDRDDPVVGVVLALRDITEESRLQRELQRVAKLDSLGVMAGGLAHDLNNLLTAIGGNVGMAHAELRETASPETLTYLADAEAGAKRARDLTRQLLTFSRGGTPVRTTVALLPLVQEAIALALTGSRSRVHVDAPADLWAVHADAGQISQVLHNLLLNADQAMPDGGHLSVSLANVTVAPGSTDPLAAGPYVRIRVADRGIGIPPAIRDRIFDPFFTTKQRGSGLGLASAYSIVRNHAGRVEVESTPGEGSEFSVFLPALLGARATVTPQKVAEAAQRSWRILVLDDEPLVATLVDRLLTRAGHSVTTAAEGAEAIDRWMQARSAGRPFDLLILDLTIPGGLGGKVVSSASLPSTRRCARWPRAGIPRIRSLPATATTGSRRASRSPTASRICAASWRGCRRGRQASGFTDRVALGSGRVRSRLRQGGLPRQRHHEPRCPFVRRRADAAAVCVGDLAGNEQP